MQRLHEDDFVAPLLACLLHNISFSGILCEVFLMSSVNGLHTLEEGVSCLSSASDLHTALTSLVRLAAEGAKAPSASFYRLDESGQVLRPFILHGLPEAYVRGCGGVLVGTQCCGRAVEHRRVWIVSDMLTDPLFAEGRKAAENSPIRSAFSIPVIDAAGRCLGSLACLPTRSCRVILTKLERTKDLVFSRCFSRCPGW